MVHKVITARPKTSLTQLAKLMRKNRVGSVIIVEGKSPVGILTEGDFIRLVARGLI
jgi:CBS domain-containing protein